MLEFLVFLDEFSHEATLFVIVKPFQDQLELVRVANERANDDVAVNGVEGGVTIGCREHSVVEIEKQLSELIYGSV